jgi:hypothetical protein
LFDQLCSYLEASAASRGDTAPQPSLALEGIVLTVLACLALQAKRHKRQSELSGMRCHIQDCLKEFGKPIEAYPEPLIEILRRTGAIKRMPR